MALLGLAFMLQSCSFENDGRDCQCDDLDIKQVAKTCEEIKELDWRMLDADKALDGSSDAPFLMCNHEQMKDFLLNSDKYNVSNIILSSDLDLSLIDFSSYDSIEQFNGIFDGKGFALNNLDLNASEVASKSGLIKTLGVNGVIQNLKINDVTMHAGSSQENAGSLVDLALGKIENIEINRATIKGSSKNLGALVGKMEASALFKNIKTTDVSVEATLSERIGGLVGHAFGTIEDVESDKTTMKGSSLDMGGMVGKLDTGASMKNIKSKDAGLDIASAERVGGLVGHALARIENAESVRTIVKGSSLDMGSMVGKLDAGGSMANITLKDAVVESISSERLGGLVGYSLGVKDLVTMSNVELKGISKHVGGAIGEMSGSAISRDFVMTNAKAHMSALELGGFAGRMGATSSLERVQMTTVDKFNTIEIAEDVLTAGGVAKFDGSSEDLTIEQVTVQAYHGAIAGVKARTSATSKVTRVNLKTATVTQAPSASEGLAITHAGGLIGSLEGSLSNSSIETSEICATDKSALLGRAEAQLGESAAKDSINIAEDVTLCGVVAESEGRKNSKL